MDLLACLEWLVEESQRYVGSVEDFIPYEGFEHVFQREEVLARAGCKIMTLAPAILEFDDGLPFEIRRNLTRLADVVRAQFTRWGWLAYLEKEGEALIEDRIKAHEATRHTAFLRAALAWRSMPGVEDHGAADRAADEARRLSLLPDECLKSPEEAKQATFRLQRAWHTEPALGPALPDPSDEELLALNRASDRICRHTRACREAQRDVEPIPAPEPPTPAEVLPLLDALIARWDELQAVPRHPATTLGVPELYASWESFKALHAVAFYRVGHPEPEVSEGTRQLRSVVMALRSRYTSDAVFPAQWGKHLSEFFPQVRHLRDKLKMESEPDEASETEPVPGSQVQVDASPSGLLPLSRRKAFSQYQDALRSDPNLATDREVYEWLDNHMEQGEALPKFSTWCAYLRGARQHFGTQKYTSRRGRAGRSIIQRGGT
jgi:hypothetical protein